MFIPSCVGTAKSIGSAQILRKVDQLENWACVSNCGACCYLSLESRPNIPKFLSEQDLSTYESLIGKDGWCINFDKQQRLCKIYENRYDFCKVEKAIAHIPPGEDQNEFAASCCRQHIGDVYGDFSIELERFEEVLKGI